MLQLTRRNLSREWSGPYRNQQMTWLRAVDMYSSDLSWDNTSEKMLFQINKMIESKINNTKIKRLIMFDYLIVGAGFAGACWRNDWPIKAGKKVLIIDKRNHIGGNTYDYYNADRVLLS